MKFPSNYKIHGVSNSGNTVTAVRSDSVPAKPVLAEVTRKGAAYQTGARRFSVPQVEIRFTRGLVEGDPSLPIPEKELASFTMRIPVGHESDTLTVLKDLQAMIAQPDFFTSLVKQVIPTCCEDAE